MAEAEGEMRFVVDVGDADFERQVLERSRAVPVVVDFWAPWCAPCRALGPILERLGIEYAGSFVLAKVNVDEASGVAARFGIRGIPAVKAFRDGRVVAEFTGAQPEAGVRRFLDAVVPSEADRLATEGEARLAAGEPAVAELRFEEALARDARHAGALLGLARVHAARGDDAEALQLLDRVPPGAPGAREARRLAAELRTRVDAVGDEATLRHRVAMHLDDLDARLALGRHLAARGRYAEALAELLEVVRRDPRHDDGAARKTMLDVFEVLGAESPLTERYRRELAATLFR
ncbi:MAG TPA: tetratricopeptide repeat protein [Candidatus Binatia bacterium]|nr:tetratricopeptide repeat protein [Candidatus Binatia bacterium]